MAQKKKPQTTQDKAASQAKREARRARTERARAAAEERRKAEQRRQRLIVGGVVVAVIAIVGAVYVGITQTGGADPETTAPPANITAEQGLLVGEQDAPGSVVIYEDFLCPACGALESSVNEQLTSGVEAGNVSVEYRPVSILGRISDYSMRSANAFAVVLDTAGPEVAKEFHDILYAEQPSESGPQPDDEWLIERAVEAGATESEVAAGIEDLAFEGWVENATDDFSKAGHTGTPTVLVDGEVVENQQAVQAITAAAQG